MRSLLYVMSWLKHSARKYSRPVAAPILGLVCTGTASCRNRCLHDVHAGRSRHVTRVTSARAFLLHKIHIVPSYTFIDGCPPQTVSGMGPNVTTFPWNGIRNPYAINGVRSGIRNQWYTQSIRNQWAMQFYNYAINCIHNPCNGMRNQYAINGVHNQWTMQWYTHSMVYEINR